MNTVKIWLVSLLLIFMTYMVNQFSSVFRLFFIAIVIAYLLNPAVQFFQKKTRNRVYLDSKTNQIYRGFAVFIVLVFVFVFLLLIYGYVRSKVVYQIVGLLDELPQLKISFQHMIGNVEAKLLQLDMPSSIIQPVQDFMMQFDSYVSKFAMQFLAWIAGLTTHVLDIVLILILLIYFMLDGEKIVRGLHEFLQIQHLNRISQLLQDTHEMLWTYIKTRVLISAGMAGTIYLGLMIGNIRYAGLFALLSFIMDFIPYFGSIISGGIIAIFALISYGTGCAVKVGIFVLIVQQLEGNVIVPKIQGDKVQVHPLLILLAILLCNAIWGPVGMLFAVPLAGVGKRIAALSIFFLLTPSGNVREFLNGTSEINLWKTLYAAEDAAIRNETDGMEEEQKNGETDE